MNLKLKKLLSKHSYRVRPFNTNYIGKHLVTDRDFKIIINECKCYNITRFRLKKLTKHGYRREYNKRNG